MPRRARIKEPYGTYHIFSRGNNKGDIYTDQDDRSAFMSRLYKYAGKYGVHVLTYCFMSNHFHFNVFTNGADISKFMQGLLLSYTIYFNKKYNRVGHLFQERFGSVLIKDDRHLLISSAYVHKNPVEANICKKPEEHYWSSMRTYLGHKDPYNIVREDFILRVLSTDKVKAMQAYARFIEMEDAACKVPDDLEMLTYENSDKCYIYKKHDPEDVFEKISAHFKIGYDQITAKYMQRYSRAKLMAQYILSQKCHLSHKAIARYFCTSPSNVGQRLNRFIDSLKLNISLQMELDKVYQCFV